MYVSENIEKADDSYLKQDTDGDGILDWAEELLGTDPANPDSDNDGTPDGEEIKLKRDPLKNGEDALSFSENNGEKKLSGLSAQIAGGIAGEYLLLKGKNGADQEEIISTLTQQIISRINTNGGLRDVFTENNITIIPTDAKTAYAYANDLGVILQKNFLNTQIGEIILLNEILENKQTERLKEFEKYEQAYANAVRELRLLPAPASFASTHLMLLNNFSNLASINNAFSNFEKDPASALLYVRYYQSEVERFKIVIKNINMVFANTGILFNEQDAGAILVDYYSQLKNSGSI